MRLCVRLFANLWSPNVSDSWNHCPLFTDYRTFFRRPLQAVCLFWFKNYLIWNNSFQSIQIVISRSTWWQHCSYQEAYNVGDTHWITIALLLFFYLFARKLTKYFIVSFFVLRSSIVHQTFDMNVSPCRSVRKQIIACNCICFFLTSFIRSFKIDLKLIGAWIRIHTLPGCTE